MQTESPSAENTNRQSLATLRHRGLFIIEFLFWAAAGAGLLILGGYLLVLFNLVADSTERLRRLVGAQIVPGTPDWLTLGVYAICLLASASLVVLAWRWYRKLWRERLKGVWRSPADLKRHGAILPLGGESRREKVEYLRKLLDSPAWRDQWTGNGDGNKGIKEMAELKGEPGELCAEEYEKASNAVFEDLEKDITERAIATGLVVGLSHSKWVDQLTIIVASFELQLHVLTRLGKKPGWRMWKAMLKRCLSSLFLNTYLNREDAFLVMFTMRKTAMGLVVLAELADQALRSLDHVDLDHLFHSFDPDETLSSLDALLMSHTGVPVGVPSSIADGALKVLKGGGGLAISAVEFSLKTGSVGLHQIANLIESNGRDLLQGVTAGGVLMSHGLELAAECLAMDAEHRASPELNRNFRGMLTVVAKRAGQLLFEHIKSTRQLFRDRRTKPFKAVAHAIKKKLVGQTAARPETQPSQKTV